MYDVVFGFVTAGRGATEVVAVDFEFGGTPFYGYGEGDVGVVSVDSATAIGLVPGVDHPLAVADADLSDAQVLEFAVGGEDCGMDEEACVLDPEVINEVEVGASVVEATYAVAVY